jgi:hypothetical protein
MLLINLENDEKLVLTVRKHWFVLVRDLFAVFLVFAIPFLLIILLEVLVGANPISDLLSSLSRAIISFAIFAWILMFWMKGFGVFTDYYLDQWTITDRRIISVDQKGFFNRETGSLRMEKIQDIEIDVSGIIETLLDFGTLRVETAGADPAFTIKGIPRPRLVKEKILEHYDPRVVSGGADQEP